MLIKDAAFTVFDFETTGLFPYSGDKICEIGAIRIDPGSRFRKRFHTMVNPEKPISYGAFLVNNITEDMVQDAPKIDEVLPGFMRFIGGSVLVAYNAGFDVGFLEYALGDKEKDVLNNYHIIDALRLARKLFPGLESYSLGNVAKALKVRPQKEHRALSDAGMTLEIFQKQLDILAAKGAHTLADIARARPEKTPPIKIVKDYRTELIRKAIREQEKLHIKYRSSWNNKVTERMISPQELQKGYDKSYVVAYCHLKNAKRNFRLDGIIDVKPEKASE
ncbi:exonuclease domain-containing protein [Candidatus Omnitrophota bacterium]